MGKKMTGEKLKAAGYQEGRLLAVALRLAREIDAPEDEVLALMKKVREYPESFLDDRKLKPLAKAMIEERDAPREELIPLKEVLPAYAVFGAPFIEEGARAQMDVAMRLPVTAGGALMPDAHQGYGLPIGGVLATENVVIPYGVGVDIGCRMALSVFDVGESDFNQRQSFFKRELIAHTKFGAGEGFKGKDRSEHAVLDRKEFGMTPFISAMRDKAWAQLGTSGGGNHFAEWGFLDVSDKEESLGLQPGTYLALLTHSGSRGFGASIAGHYTKVAKDQCKLPKEAVNLAYLDLNSEAGSEYWMAMNLAGDYASACHEVIHRKLAKAIGAEVLARVENHHNFAWKEMWMEKEVIIHRKGATPAGKGVMGIIPGSMAAPGFVVKGRGDMSSLNSASHGAGRLMSRSKAVQSITRSQLKGILEEKNVTLIGAGLDEAPMAYKDIHAVMNAQQELVDVVAVFNPRMVRMAQDGSRED